MGNNTVDSLQIEIEARSATAAGEIDRLAASLQRLQGATRQPGLERVSKQLQGLTKAPSMAAMEKELARLEKQAIKDGDALLALQNKLEGLQAFRGVGNKLTIADTEGKIRETEREIRELSAAVDGADAKIRALKKSLETGGTVPAFSAPKADPQLGQASTNLAPVEVAAKNVTEAFNALNEVVRRVSDNLSSVSESTNGLNSVTQRSKETASGIERISEAAKQADSKLEGVADGAKDVGRAAKDIKQSVAGLEDVSRAARNTGTNLNEATRNARQLGNTVEKAGLQGASGLDKIISRLKSMAANFLIFSFVHKLIGSIGDTIGRMAAENAKVNETMSKIASSVQYVADALGAAIYPIIVALQPVITTILDGLAEVLNFIARIVAFFTGQDYVIQAKKTQVDFSESLDGTADSMNGVSAAAKEMARNLLGIDELNIIDKPTKTGGGNGGSGLGDLRFEEIKNDFKLPEMIKSPVWSPNPIPAPQFEPVTLPEWSTATLHSPAWSPAFVPAPVFETVPIPELAGQTIPSPEWVPQMIQAPVFETLSVPELAGQKLPSPEWEPSLVCAPEFEPLRVPELAEKTLRSPTWEPSLILAPAFEALVLPEWALSPLPVPEWAQNPIPSPAIDTTAVLSGLSQMEQAFATAWSGIQARVSEGVAAVQEKLQSARQTIEAFASTTQASFAAWGENVKTNFSAVMEYIPTVTVPALQKSASTVVSYLSGTADGFMAWGESVATNFREIMGYLPGAAAEGLTAAGKSVVDWANSTSDSFASWGGNIIQTGAKAISGFVQNFVSGLAHAWDEFVGFLKATGEKISGWWSANKHWAAPVGAAALAGVGIGAFVLSGGAAGLVASIPSMAKVALPAMAFANGGVVRSPTLGLVGEYPGARSNPEIIAPQSILRDTFRAEQEKQDYSEVINAINAGIGAIVAAINDQDYGTHLDGRSLMQSVERAQRERGASIMPSVL